MNSKENYSIIISSKVNILVSQIYFEQKFPLYNFLWKDIYILSHKVTVNAYLRSFQYKILNNLLYLNKKLENFGLSNTELCSFCTMEEIMSLLFSYFLIHSNYIYIIRGNVNFLSSNNFLNNIRKMRNLERRIAINNQNKYEEFR